MLVGRVVGSEVGVYVKVRGDDGVETTVTWAQVLRMSTDVPRSELGTAGGTTPAPVASGTPAAAGTAPAPGPAPQAPATPQQSETTPATADIGHGGLSLQAGGKLEGAEQRRAQWLEDGGWLVGGDAMAQVVVLRMSSIDLSGYGFGGGLHGSLLNLTPPGPDDGSWFGFRVGAGVDAAAVKVSVGDESIAAQSVVVPFTAGAQIGIGSGEGNAWSGVMLGADYRPSYQYTQVKGYDGSGGVSWTGFQVTADFVSFDAAAESLAASAQWRLSVFLLPETKKLPFLLVLGAGAVWY